MIEKQVRIETKAGAMPTIVCHPERGGPHPGVIVYMDAPGIREELVDMARRIATVGYYVLLPDLYYRSGGSTGYDPSKMDQDGPDRKRIFELHNTLTNALVMDDTAAMLAFVDGQPEVKKAPLGCVGYCMSGHFVMTAAGTFPERFAAIASIFGTALITEEPDSPHRLADRIKGEIYFCCAEKDRWSPPEFIARLEEVMAKSGATHEVETFAGTDHAFAFPSRRAYDKAATERHWERLFELFRRRLDR
jgi:carboxymethylenebutenolidase